MVRVHAVLAAAGQGVRMGAVGSKVLLAAGGQSILARAVEAFDHSPNADAIHVVAAEAHLEAIRHELAHRQWRKPIEVSVGGARRQDSVYLALQRLPPCDFVIIHDAARPLVSQELIAGALEAALQTGAATVAVPLTDTCKQVGPDGLVQQTLPRARLQAAQTPQAFRYDWLIEAHAQGQAQGWIVDDDAELVERLGHPVRVVPGDPRNLKVATPADLLVLQAFLKFPSPLVGEG
jgi:2-C-methyl-D-erythritol 4-phosphate cytidylyltransferase